jgi:hypothetical protein
VDVVLSSGFLSFANHAGFLRAMEEVRRLYVALLIANVARCLKRVRRASSVLTRPQRACLILRSGHHGRLGGCSAQSSDSSRTTILQKPYVSSLHEVCESTDFVSCTRGGHAGSRAIQGSHCCVIRAITAPFAGCYGEGRSDRAPRVCAGGPGGTRHHGNLCRSTLRQPVCCWVHP